MARSALPWAVLAALTPVLALSCVSRPTYLKTYNQLEKAEQALEDALKRLGRLEGIGERHSSLDQDHSRLKAELDAAKKKLEEAEGFKQKLDQLAQRVREGLGVSGISLGDPDIDVTQGLEGITLSIKGEVLFASGQAELAESGRSTLLRVAKVLKNETGQVRVAGHTDTDPIVKSQWRSNTELSARRAVEVAEFLVAEGKVPRNRLEVAGYGEFRPRAPENMQQDKAKNRRVEIILLRAPL